MGCKRNSNHFSPLVVLILQGKEYPMANALSYGIYYNGKLMRELYNKQLIVCDDYCLKKEKIFKECEKMHNNQAIVSECYNKKLRILYNEKLDFSCQNYYTTVSKVTDYGKEMCKNE